MKKTKSWSVKIDEADYLVTFTPSLLIAKIKLVVNGAPITIERHFPQGFIGIDQPFTLGGKECHFILWNGKPDLVVDGVFLDSKKPYTPRPRIPWWLWIILFLLFILLAMVGTGAIPVFLLVLAALYSFRFATSPNMKAAARFFSCLGLTVAAGLLSFSLLFLAINSGIASSVIFGDGALRGVIENNMSKEIVSEDNHVSLTAPGSWKNVVPGSDPSVLLRIGNDSADQYILVAWESKADFTDSIGLAEYYAKVKEIVSQNFTDPVWTVEQEARFGAYPAIRSELTGTASNIKIHYFYTFIETSDSFYRVIGYTRQSKADANRMAIIQIMDTFKEINRPGN
jgi:hypothetical protein